MNHHDGEYQVSSQASDLVIVDEPAEGVCRIAIHLPQKRNALNPQVVSALHPAFTAALHEAKFRAIILTGSDGTFCSGGDLGSMDAMTESAARERMQRNHLFASLVRNAHKPVVAAVEGYAMGGGAGLALLSDLVIAGRTAKIGFPFLRIGLLPDYGLMHVLGRRVGWARAKQLILTNATVTGEQAATIALVDRVVDDAQVQTAAVDAAIEFAKLPAHAFAEVKRAFAEFPRSFSEDMAHELAGQVAAFVGAELLEGVAAFREKRAPDFRKIAQTK